LGGFIDLYKHLGINIDYFRPQARNSLQSIIPLLTNRQKINVFKVGTGIVHH